MRTTESNATNLLAGAVLVGSAVSSKSLTNRLLPLLILVRKTVLIQGLLVSEDTEIMSNTQRICVTYGFRNPKATACKRESAGHLRGQHEFYVGNSGTSARFLSPVLCFSSGTYLMHGTPRMHSRPIEHLYNCLRTLGANLQCTRNSGRLPMIIRPPHDLLSFCDANLEGNISSQFITAAFFGAKLRTNTHKDDVVINQAHTIASRAYIRMTLLLMERFGLSTERQGWERYKISNTAANTKDDLALNIETDFTSASYFLVSGLVGNGWTLVPNAPIFGTQGDVSLVSILRSLGLCVWVSQSNLVIVGSRRPIGPVWLSCNSMPDVAMTIMTLMSFGGQRPSHFDQLLTLRFKETDRMLALAMELRKFQQIVECSLDWVRLRYHSPNKGPRNQAVRVQTYQDHRVAMCCSVLCFMGNKVRVEGSDCTNKTFPDFFYAFNNLANGV